MAVSARKVVLIKKATRLDQLIARFNSVQQVKFYIEHIGGNFADYENEHSAYQKSLERVILLIEKTARIHVIDWLQLPNYQFNPDDVIATIGQDGLVVNALKYLDDQYVIGFNSDKSRWDGTLAQFSPNEAYVMIEKCLQDDVETKHITKGVVTLSDNQKLYAVNDFFIGVADHASARYQISYQEKQEMHSSSGVLVSTPLGRSAWMKSVISGAKGIMNGIQKTNINLIEKNQEDWSNDYLYFAVREPFPSVSSENNLVFGKISGKDEFSIESKMGENGIIFSDGIQSDFLGFNYSVKAAFSIAEKKGRIVIRES
jgi:NAD kinase